MEDKFSHYSLIGEDIFDNLTKKFIKIKKESTNGYLMVNARDDKGGNHPMQYAKLKLILSQPLEDYTDMEVDHIDSNKLNNNLNNLQWLSKSENRKKRESFTVKNRNREMLVRFDGSNKIQLLTNTELKNCKYVTVWTYATGKEGHYFKKKKCTISYEINDLLKEGETIDDVVRDFYFTDALFE